MLQAGATLSRRAIRLPHDDGHASAVAAAPNVKDQSPAISEAMVYESRD
jgi:hypothetical protein